jgi:hypothetical protein
MLSLWHQRRSAVQSWIKKIGREELLNKVVNRNDRRTGEIKITGKRIEGDQNSLSIKDDSSGCAGNANRKSEQAPCC